MSGSGAVGYGRMRFGEAGLAKVCCVTAWLGWARCGWVLLKGENELSTAVLERKNGVDAIREVTNEGEFAIQMQTPYVAEVTIKGTAPILFHRWSCESVAEKAGAAKGSKAKKTDDTESYVYRDDGGNICIPGRYLVGSMTNPQNGAAKYLQDPRSPRKSALDLYKAGVVPLTILAPILVGGKMTRDWDYLDQQRVTIQRAGVTRIRPAFHPGYEAHFEIQVLTPEYITPTDLLTVLTQAGRLVGLGDFRPTYGRFQVTRFEIQKL